MPSVSRGRSKTPTERTQPAAVRAASPSSQQKKRKASAQRKKTVSPTPAKKKSSSRSSSAAAGSPPSRRSSSVSKSPVAPSSGSRRSARNSTKLAAVGSPGEDSDFVFGVLVDRSKTFTHASSSSVARKSFIRKLLGSWAVECAHTLFEPWEQGIALLLYAIVLWPLVWGLWRVTFYALQAAGVDDAVNEGVKLMTPS